ncbi:DUF3892 domain-containing protein [Streptomyces sp. NPDC006638]|uniref:DUF3892 domain-containing protein n=1 Tax=Streptomyces sp. NPDC006638 TaxID=3157183 RepID=UPI0033AAE015
MTGGLTFLSWVREGLAATGVADDPLTGPLPARTTLTLHPRVNERPERTVRTRLYGPGDITALDPAQILRTFPAPDSRDAEPQLFAAVEFDRPDLPWMFSPAGAAARGRLRPWLVLVVVEAAGAVLDTAPGGGLPRLVCSPAELPDLAHSWAWAHAQVTTNAPTGGTAYPEEVNDLLAHAPERTLSRLLCPRRLTPETAYLAAVVPAFEAGRLTGLGRPLPPADRTELRPAWPPVPGAEEPWQLPVYHHWFFGTGLDGDFESLVQALTPRALPGDVGTRPLDVGRAGDGLPALPPGGPGRLVDLQGALRTAGTEPLPWHEPTAAAFRAAYSRVLDGGPPGAAGEPELAPPVYGAAQAGGPPARTPGGGTRLPSPQAGPYWLRQVNLDPRHRAAAALGAEVVRHHQEDLVAAAWDQAADLRRANDALRQGQLARTVSDSLHRRLAPPPGDDLADARLLQITATARDLAGYGSGTAAGEVDRNREAAAALTPAFRRLLRPGGPLAARTGAAADTGGAGLAAQLTGRRAAATPPLSPPAGGASVEDVSGSETFARISADRLTRRGWEDDLPGPAETPASVVPDIRFLGAVMTTRLFATTHDGRVLSRFTSFQGTVGWTDHGTPPGTTAVGPPTAVRDLHAFVVGANGSLYRLGWDGDRYLWYDHGRPPGGPLDTGSRLGSVARNERRVPGGTQNRTYDSVYGLAAGQLWELKFSGSLWIWEGLGTPQGKTLTGVPAVLHPWSVSAVATDGSLNMYSANEDGVWSWLGVGRPAAGFDPYEIPVRHAASFLVGYMAKGKDGKMYACRFGGLMLYEWYAVRDEAGHTLGSIGDSRAVTTTNAPGVAVCTGGTDWSEPGGRAPGAAGTPLNAVLKNAVVWAVRDGLLLRLDLDAATPAWQQLDRTAFCGRGALTAYPPRDIRWRPRLGFRSNLLLGDVSESGARYRVGRNTDFDGRTESWAGPSPLPAPVNATTAMGFALAAADLDPPAAGRESSPDLVAFWIQDHPLGNFGMYSVGRTLNSEGIPASWSPTQQLPVPMSTTDGATGALVQKNPVLGGTATLADLDNDGKQELLVVYLAGTPGNRRLFLRIGWALDPVTGTATGGWTDSEEIPWPGRPSDTAPAVLGMGLAVADLDGDLRPELVVLLMEQTGSGGSAGVTGSYRIGWNINARGRIVGPAGGGSPWSNVRTIPGSFGPRIAGAGLAVADFSGNQRPDLLVFTVDDPDGANRASYRIGTDVKDGTATAWSTPLGAHPGGSFGSSGRGAAVCVTDLPGNTLARKRAIAANFRTAATAHQTALLAAQAHAVQHDEPRLALSGLADAVHTAVDPEKTVTARVTARLEGLDLDGAALRDPLGPLLAPPSFPQPMAELLTELGQDHLLPGVERVPPDTITLLRTDPSFVESFLTGANHELGRELLWRGFPTDRSATSFRHFWDARGTTDPGAEPPDVPPLAEWPRHARLGTVAHGPAGGEAVVLLLRGEVVRRYPALGLHARRALAPTVPGGPPRLGTQRRDPVFSGALEPDVLYFGFPLTAAEVRGGGPGGDPGWFFVFEEHPGVARFGLDAVPERDAAYGGAPEHWRAVSWASVAAGKTELDALRYAPLLPPFGELTLPLRPPPVPPGRSPVPPGSPEPAQGPEPALATWAHNSAHMAHITLQQPARVAFHATDLLPSFGAGRRITHVRKRAPGSDRVLVRELAGPDPAGGWWRLTAAQVIAAIENRESFYVEGAPGHRVAVRVAHDAHGVKRLRTGGDGDTSDNLLELPSIPPGAGLPPQYSAHGPHNTATAAAARAADSADAEAAAEAEADAATPPLSASTPTDDDA